MLNFPNFPMIKNFLPQALFIVLQIVFFPLPQQMFKLSLLCRIHSSFFPIWPWKQRPSPFLSHILNYFKTEALWPFYDTLLVWHTKCWSERQEEVKGLGVGKGREGGTMYLASVQKFRKCLRNHSPSQDPPHPLPSSTLIKKDVSDEIGDPGRDTQGGRNCGPREAHYHRPTRPALIPLFRYPACDQELSSSHPHPQR